MPGAVVPDDWNGSDYTTRQVVWPNSPLWLEILGGGLSIPSLVSFWDETTGDAEEAAAIGQSLIDLNIVDGFYPGKAIIPMSERYFTAFRAGSPNSISAGAWTPIAYAIANGGVEKGNHGWLTDRQEIRSEQYGLWLYNFAIGGLSAIHSEFYLGIWSGYPALAVPLLTMQYPNTARAVLPTLLYFDVDTDVQFAAFHQTGATFSTNGQFTFLRGVHLASAI